MLKKMLTFLLVAYPLLGISSYPVTEKPCVYSESKGTVNCRNGRLDHIPYEYLRDKNFSTLDLGYNYIISLNDTENFYELKYRAQIKTIFLDHNNISHIPSRLFDALPNFQILDLSHNRIKHISHWVCHAIYLKEVLLSGNPVEPVARHVLTCNKGLMIDIELIAKDPRKNDKTESSAPTSTSSMGHLVIVNAPRNTNNRNGTNTKETKNQTTNDDIFSTDDKNQTHNEVSNQDPNCAHSQYSVVSIFVTFILIINNIFT